MLQMNKYTKHGLLHVPPLWSMKKYRKWYSRHDMELEPDVKLVWSSSLEVMLSVQVYKPT